MHTSKTSVLVLALRRLVYCLCFASCAYYAASLSHSAECEAARVQIHAMEVQRMKDKETVRQQFEEIEHAFVSVHNPCTLQLRI